MYYKQFHNIGISALGMGGLRFPMERNSPDRIDRKKGQKLVDAAIAGGINYFDTAYTYQGGDSERFLGEALSQYPRESFLFATKFYVTPGADLETIFEEQLSRCQMDYFDFYLLHSVTEKSIAAYTDESKNYIGYLLEQKRLGRIRYLGFSSHAAPDTLERFLEWYDDFDMALIQLNYVDWNVLDAKRQYDILTERGIPIWVMEPLKGGRLSNLNEEGNQLLKAAAPDQSVSSWGFRFLMGLPNVQTVLSGMTTQEQLLDNLAIFDRWNPLSPKEAQTLEQVRMTLMRDLGVPCSDCRYCCASCPAELGIPLLIRGYNEYNISGELWRVAGLATGKGPKHCIECGVCMNHCPQRIDIPKVLKELSSILEKR